MSDSSPIPVEIPEALADLIPNYMDGIKKSSHEMLTFLNNGDLETTRSMGHKMKGSGGGYGFEKISQLGKEIEEASKKEAPAEVLKAIEELQDYLERVEITYVDSQDW